MTLGVIIAIILIALVLIFLEVFLIPGTSLFGIAGGIALIIGILLVYTYYGSKWGHITLVSCMLLVVVAVAAGFKVIQSNKLAMKAEIKSRVNELERDIYEVGDKGIALSDFRPNGKGSFRGNKIEVYSNGEYIQRESEIEIIKITGEKIFVKQYKT